MPDPLGRTFAPTAAVRLAGRRLRRAEARALCRGLRSLRPEYKTVILRRAKPDEESKGRRIDPSLSLRMTVSGKCSAPKEPCEPPT